MIGAGAAFLRVPVNGQVTIQSGSEPSDCSETDMDLTFFSGGDEQPRMLCCFCDVLRDVASAGPTAGLKCAVSWSRFAMQYFT